MAEWLDLNSVVGLNGKNELVADSDAIQNSIYNILTCPIGTRGWHPTYGSLLPKLIYEPLDDRTANLIRANIIQALQMWEPRITVTQDACAVIPLKSGPPGYSIVLTYSIKTTGQIDQTSFTFTR